MAPIPSIARMMYLLLENQDREGSSPALRISAGAPAECTETWEAGFSPILCSRPTDDAEGTGVVGATLELGPELS